MFFVDKKRLCLRKRFAKSGLDVSTGLESFVKSFASWKRSQFVFLRNMKYNGFGRLQNAPGKYTISIVHSTITPAKEVYVKQKKESHALTAVWDGDK